jgi:hypothetical protein
VLWINQTLRLAKQFRLGSLPDPGRTEQQHPVRTPLGWRNNVALPITSLEPCCSITLLSHSRLHGDSLSRLFSHYVNQGGQEAETG